MTKPSRFRSFCLFSVLISLALAALPVSAQTDPPATVRVAPATIDIPLGQTADVAIEVVEAQDIYGFDLALTFDPAAVEIVDADPNQAGVQTALGTFLEPGFVVLNAANNVSGTLRFAMTQLNPSLPKSGTGTLIVIRLRGKQLTSSTLLTLNSAQLARRDGRVLSANPISGRISVVASTGSSPTRTPIPTQGAGTPMPTSAPPPTVPTVVNTVMQPTAASPATGSSATITPEPANPPAATAPSAPTQSPAASSTSALQSDNGQNPATSLPTEAAPAPAATEAVSVSSTPANVPAIVASPQSPVVPDSSSTDSAATLLVVSGVVGLIGIATVWFVTRRRSQ